MVPFYYLWLFHFQKWTMPKLKKSIQSQNLAKYRTWITDTDSNSRYFRLNQIPDVLTGGKNAFLINGSNELVGTTDVKVELIDSEGNAVFVQPIRNYVEGLARVISIEVYDDTPSGPATLTILGQLRVDENGVEPPDEWKNAYNVRWQKQVVIEPTLPNTTRIRLYQRPEITVNEILATYRRSIPGDTLLRSGTGSITIRTNTNSAEPIPGLPAFTTTLITDGLVLDQRFANNGFVFAKLSGSNGLVSDYTASISKIINNRTAQLSFIDGIPADVAPRTTTAYSMSFVDDTRFFESELSRSFASVSLTKLTTFSGDVARARLYVRSIDQPGEYELVTDTRLEATELTLVPSVVSSDQFIRIGDFTNQDIIDQYWDAGLVVNNQYVVTSSVSVSIDSSEVIDGAFISNPLTPFNTPSTTPKYFFGVKNSLSFVDGLEYTFSADIVCAKTNPLMTARMDVYLVGDAFPPSAEDPLGYKLASFTVESGQVRREFFDYSRNFLALQKGNATLRFVVYSGGWYWSNVSVASARESGFNPDQVQIVTPIVGRRFERLQFKAELYDSNNNYVPIIIESDPVLFDGGNLIFRGDDTRIDGVLTVSPSGSGPVLTSRGFFNTASVFIPGQALAIGPKTPQVRNRNTAFFAGSSSFGPEVSIGDKLYGYLDSNTDQFNLEIDGTILIVTGSDKFDIRELFPQMVCTATVVDQDNSFVYVSASAVDPLGLVSGSVFVDVQPSGSTDVVFNSGRWDITRPSGSVVSKVKFIARGPNRRDGTDFVMVQPITDFTITGSVVNTFLQLVMANTNETANSLFVSTSVNGASGSMMTPIVSVFSSNNVQFVTPIGGGRYEIGKPVSGIGEVVFRNSLAGFTDDYDSVIVPNQGSTVLPALNVRATVTSESPTEVIVSCSVVDPLNQPSFTLIPTKEPASANITITGTNPFTVSKPVGADTARVRFTATQLSRIPDSDIVTLQPVPPFISLVMTALAETPSALFVSQSVNRAFGASVSPTVEVVGTPLNVEYVTLNNGVYEIGKPISGVGEVVFGSTLAGYIPDFDTVVVGNRQDTVLPYLVARANVIAQSSTTITVSCSVENPLNIPGAVLSYEVQPENAVTVTGTNPFTITRPSGNGTAFVIFTAAQSGFNSDTDSVVITPQPLPSLVVRCRLLNANSTSATYEVIVDDPLPQNSITVTFTGVLTNVTPTSATVSSGVPTTITASRPANGAGVGRITIRATSSGRVEGVDAVDVPEQDPVDLGAGAATVDVGSVIISSLNVQVPFSVQPSSTVRYVEVWAQESRVAFTDSGSTRNFHDGFQIKQSAFQRPVGTVIGVVPVAVSGNWITVWVVPFDSQGRQGPIQARMVKTPVAATTPPSPFQSRTNVSVNTTSVVNRVQMPASDLPTTIRVYRNGSFFTDIPRTAPANGNQDMTHSGLTPSTTDTWVYEPLASDGTAGSQTSPLNTTTLSLQLSPPTFQYNGLVNNRLRFQNVDSNLPANFGFFGQYNISGGPWINLVPVSFVPQQMQSNETISVGQFGQARFQISAPGFITSEWSTPINWSSAI